MSDRLNTKEEVYRQALVKVAAHLPELRKVPQIQEVVDAALLDKSDAVPAAELVTWLQEMHDTIEGWELDADDETGEIMPGMVGVAMILAKVGGKAAPEYPCITCGNNAPAAEYLRNHGTHDACTRESLHRALDNAATLLESLERGETVAPALIANAAYEARSAEQRARGEEGV